MQGCQSDVELIEVTKTFGEMVAVDNLGMLQNRTHPICQ